MTVVSIGYRKLSFKEKIKNYLNSFYNSNIFLITVGEHVETCSRCYGLNIPFIPLSRNIKDQKISRKKLKTKLNNYPKLIINYLSSQTGKFQQLLIKYAVYLTSK